MTASKILAKAAAAATWQTLPGDVKAAIEDLFLDALAVGAAGVAHPSFRPWAEAMTQGGGYGPSSVLALPGKVAPTIAALLNGGATTVHQLQRIKGT